MTPPNDNRIMEAVRSGQVEKLAVLFERHHVRLYNFFLRLTGSPAVSEDLVQDVFLRILKYRSTFLGHGRFELWMYQIARNAHIDFLRKKKPDLSLEDQFEDPAEEEESPAESIERGEDASRVREALSRLPLKKREVLILSRFQEMKYRDIAELLGCREGTVKAHVHRAVKELGRIYMELQGGHAT